MTKNVRLEEWADGLTFGRDPKKGTTLLSWVLNKLLEIATPPCSVKVKKGGWYS